MELGTVNWFNITVGWGFITSSKSEEVFLHFNYIEGQKGRKSLMPGDKVSFDTVEIERNGKPSKQARNVRLIESVPKYTRCSENIVRKRHARH